MAKSKLATDRFRAAMCRESYYEFFLEMWDTVVAETLIPSWYIRKLCDELQCVSERVFKGQPKDGDTIINYPPGCSKSSIVSIFWQPWIWTRMPSARFISGSYSERLAMDLSTKSRDCVRSDKYQRYFPEIQMRTDTDTKGFWKNSHGGFRYAVGVGGSVLGHHAHFIAVDDPIDPQGVLSDLTLAEVNNWMNETLSRRKVSLLLTPTVLVMQRLHQYDPTANMLERKRNVKQIVLPAYLLDTVLPTSWREFYQDGLLDSVRLPKQVLEEAYLELGPEGFACQYDQSPVPRGGAMFKIDRLSYQTTAPHTWSVSPVRAWDKAGTSKGGCFTVGTKSAISVNKKQWVLNVVRGQWDTGSRENVIMSTAEADGRGVRVVIEEEPGSGGKHSAETTVRMLTNKGYRATAIKPSGDKEVRADVFSQKVNLGDVIILVGDWNTAFVDELKFFPRSRYMDQVDSISLATQHLTKARLVLGGGFPRPK